MTNRLPVDQDASWQIGPDFQQRSDESRQLDRAATEDIRQPLLEIRGLSFTYDASTPRELKVFSDFGAVLIRDSEWVSIIGPSGCGKTTLLDLIAGLATPTAGQLVWGVNNLTVGYVFQDYPFLPRQTVAGHIGFPLYVRNQSHETIIRVVQEWVEMVGLKGFEDYPLSSLSVGMKARVALATTLISAPTVLLLDEPFRALDLDTRMQMWELLAAVRKKKSFSLLLISHDLTETIALSDRVLVLTKAPSKILSERALQVRYKGDVSLLMETEEFSRLHRELLADLRTAIDS